MNSEQIVVDLDSVVGCYDHSLANNQRHEINTLSLHQYDCWF